MKTVTPGVTWLTAAVGANAYLLDAGDRVALIDPGMSLGLNRVARSLHAHDRSPHEVTDILLTHYDPDHAQVAAEWQRRTGARVWLGAADAAILTGATPPPSRFRKFTAALGLPELPRGLNLLDGETEVLPDVRALPTPGHTPGHYVFVHADVAFIGDSAMVTSQGRLTRIPNLLMSDLAEGERSRALVDALDVSWFCSGHSAPARRVGP